MMFYNIQKALRVTLLEGLCVGLLLGSIFNCTCLKNASTYHKIRVKSQFFLLPTFYKRHLIVTKQMDTPSCWDFFKIEKQLEEFLLFTYIYFRVEFIQVNLCLKHLFSHQLTHNMAKNCSLIHQFSTELVLKSMNNLVILWDS